MEGHWQRSASTQCPKASDGSRIFRSGCRDKQWRSLGSSEEMTFGLEWSAGTEALAVVDDVIGDDCVRPVKAENEARWQHWCSELTY